MREFIPHIDAYLKMSGQTLQELMSGAHQYGGDFVLNDLVKETLRSR